MVNKNNTLTVADLLKMLADGQVTMDMPITIWDSCEGTVRGLNAVEIHTYKDGSKSLSIFEGAPCADIKDVLTTVEVYL